MRMLALVRFPNESVQNNDLCLYPLKFGKMLKQNLGIPFDTLTLSKMSDSYKLCYVYGAERAYILSDHQFAGADTYLTAYFLSRTIYQLEQKYDLIVCSMLSSHGETAHVPAGIAANLDLPFVFGTERISSLDNDYLNCYHFDSDKRVQLHVRLPAVLSLHYRFCFSEGLIPTLYDHMSAGMKELIRLNYSFLALDVNADTISKTEIVSGEAMMLPQKHNVMIERNLQEQIKILDAIRGDYT